MRNEIHHHGIVGVIEVAAGYRIGLMFLANCMRLEQEDKSPGRAIDVIYREQRVVGIAQLDSAPSHIEFQ